VLLTVMTNESSVVLDDCMRFSSGPLALLEPSTNSALLSLCCSQSAMLPSYNSLCDNKQCCLSGRFAPFQQWSVQLQIVLSIRLLCSLPTTVCAAADSVVYCYQRTVIVLSDHPRWMFRKNSIEFFIGLSYYLYYFTSGYTLKSCSHKSFQNVLWSHDSGHMVCLFKFLHYLYLDPIVYLDVVDQMFKCMGNYFLLGALITWPLLQVSSS